MQWLRLAAAIAAAVVFSSGSALATDLGQLKRDYGAAKRVVGANDSIAGYSVDGKPRVTRALETEWEIVSNWLAGAALSERLSNMQLNDALKNLDPEYTATVLNLDPEIYVIGIQRFGFGTFFIVRREGAHWNIIWDVRKVTAVDRSHIPSIVVWLPIAATIACAGKRTEGTWDQCGPVSVDGFGLLPRDPNRHSRFYVDAWYAQAAGETESFQLSVWTWNGQRAIPHFAKVYSQMIEVDHTPRLKNDVLLIQTKEDFKNFFSCGSCIGRQAEWKLKITPMGVQDLGTESHMPEVDAIDDLVGRIAHDKPTSDLAAPAVVRMLAPLVAAQKDESHKINPNWFSLGMIGNGEAETNPANKSESLVCFSTDSDDERYLFTLDRRPTGFFIAKVRDLGEGDTPDRLCSKPNL